MRNLKLITVTAAILVATGAYAQKPAPKPKPQTPAPAATAKPAADGSQEKSDKITYLAGSKAEFISKMRTTGTPGFMYLYVDKNAKCASYEKDVLSDTSIVKLVDSNMLAFKLNAADFPYEATSLGIEDIPSLALYDRTGHLVGRLDGFHTVEEVRKFLQKVVN